MKKHLLLTVLAGGMALTTVPADASPITNLTGLVAPSTTITFSEVPLPNLTPLTTQYAGLGVTFAGLYVDSTFIPFSGAANYQSGCAGACTPFDIFFTSPVTSGAFRLLMGTGNVTLQAFLDGTLVESFTAPTTLPNFPFPTTYFGFQNTLFNQIHVIPLAGLNGANIDNIQFNRAPQAVPEPSTLLLVGLGLAAIAGRRFRTRALI